MGTIPIGTKKILSSAICRWIDWEKKMKNYEEYNGEIPNMNDEAQ